MKLDITTAITTLCGKSLESALEGVVPVTLDEFFFQSVSCGQVCKVVESFPSNKAPGRD